MAANWLPASIFLGWLIALVLVICPPPDPPPSAPAGVGLCRGFPVHYAAPAPLSARIGQHSGVVIEVPNDQPLSYDERFSPDCVGPEPDYSALGDHAYFEARSLGCPVAQAAVAEQGVGH